MIEKLKAAAAAVKNFWANLPHPVQAIAVGFVSALAVTFVHTLSEGHCYTFVCIKSAFWAGIDIAFGTLDGAMTALMAGSAAGATFYMKPNKQDKS